MNRCPGNLLTTYLSRGCSFGYIPFLLNNTNNTMSPYKFRVYAKTNDNGGYLETYQEGESGIHFYYDGGLRGISYFLTYSNIFDVEQSTGLKDKEDNLIYSGDIVEGSFYDTEYRYYEKVTAQVTWKDGMFNIASDLWHKPSLIIIGNKHETNLTA